jgi:hypothetical protein
MNRKVILVLLITALFAVQPLFAAVTGDISYEIRYNEYYLESIRLTKLAQETYEYGDYDASASFAEESIRYALLSDEYIGDQLIHEARRLLDLADSANMAAKRPNDYKEGKDYYETSLEAQSNGDWNDAISMASNAIVLLTFTDSDAAPASPANETPVLPGQYTVRPWAVSKDCLWNIAGRSWVYGDPQKWKVLYFANQSKLPNPDNPDLIETGMVLEIPSLWGETRQGMWDSSKEYGTP